MEQQIDLKSDSGWTVSKTLQVVSLWVLTSTFLGFLIVNSYFAFFGFWDSDFLKVQYVAAGTLFLLLVSFPALCAIIYFKIRKYLINCRVLNKGIFTRIWTYAVEVVFLLFALYLSAMPIIVSLLFGHFSMNPTISIDVISIFWMVIVWISVIVIFKSRDKITEAKNTDSVFKKGFMYFSAYYIFLYFLFAVPVLIGMFVWFVYPFVPRHFGGGEVVYVNIGLVPTFDVKQINITNPLNAFLIYQSADSLFILTLTGDSFLLKRSDVAYVKYLESNKVLDTLKNSVSINNSTSTPR